jgi:hypothetical protein
MPAPSVLFVCHTGSISGAELVLIDLVQPWAGEAAFLFEDGPLHQALAAKGLKVRVSRWGEGLSDVRRDSSILKAFPLIGRLGAIIAELTREARRHDVIYANSQKAFVLSAVAATLARRPLIWHLHDIISSEHFAGELLYGKSGRSFASCCRCLHCARWPQGAGRDRAQRS